jgi:hypothetical protein
VTNTESGTGDCGKSEATAGSPLFRNYYATGRLMKDDVEVGQHRFAGLPEKQRKPGRPTVIPPTLEQAVVNLYRRGHGYRAIASHLAAEYGLNPDYSSVRRTLLRLGAIPGRA